MSIFAKLFNRGAVAPENPQRAVYWYPNRYVPTDLRLSADEALSLSAVYGCVRVISEAIASSDWEVYTKQNGERKELEDDPIGWLINKCPNPESTAQGFKEAILVQSLIHGNSYAEIVWDVAGRVKELWLLPTDWVTPERNTTDGSLRYRVSGHDGMTRYLDASDVLHFRALSSVSQLMGDSPVSRASRAIALAHASERYAINYYGSNATVGGILKLPRTLKPEEEQALSDSWKTGHEGAGKAHKTAILPPGVEWQAMSNNAEESQVLSSRQFSVDEIIRYFGVPGILLNQNVQLPGQNIEGLGLLFVRHTLTPWTKRISQELDRKLFPQRAPWKFIEIELDWLTEGDAKTRADTFKVYLDAGVMCVNEVRDELKMNSIGPDGDEYKSVSSSPDPAADPAADGMDGTKDPQDDETDGATGLENLFRLVLKNHADRIKGREAELAKTLRNGVLAEKVAHAKDWSRGMVERDLNKAGINPPPGWLQALEAVEKGGDAGSLAKSLLEVRN